MLWHGFNKPEKRRNRCFWRFIEARPRQSGASTIGMGASVQLYPQYPRCPRELSNHVPFQVPKSWEPGAEAAFSLWQGFASVNIHQPPGHKTPRPSTIPKPHFPSADRLTAESPLLGFVWQRYPSPPPNPLL